MPVLDADTSAFPFDDPRYRLSKVLNDEMSPEQVAIQALHGAEFASMEAAHSAIRSVAAAIEIITTGPVKFGPVLVS